MLESWVRYEGQVKQRQQKELAESVIAKVQKELENPKVLQQILQQSITDVESKSSNPRASTFRKHVLTGCASRNRLLQGPIDNSTQSRWKLPPRDRLSFVPISVCYGHTCANSQLRLEDSMCPAIM